MENDSDPERSALRLIAENNAADLESAAALKRVQFAVRELAANLLRIIRGAGRPHQLGQDAQALIESLTEYQNRVGRWPFAEEVSAALSIAPSQEFRQQLTGASLDRVDAEEMIIRGVLQQVASRLTGQRTHERLGKSEMYEGIRDLRSAQEAMRKELKAPAKGAAARKTPRPIKAPPRR